MTNVVTCRMTTSMDADIFSNRNLRYVESPVINLTASEMKSLNFHEYIDKTDQIEGGQWTKGHK